jgi:peptide/nickel transport system substrate-binding protein
MDPQGNSFAVLHETGPAIVYSRLMRFDLDKYPQEIAFTGDLAESFENPDPQTFTFKLRPNIKWQNIPPVSGRALNAQDIVYSYQRTVSEKTNAGIISAIEKVEAPDDNTITMTLKTPDADFMYAVADSRMKIVAREAVEVNGDLKNGPAIGSGPWIFDEWVPEQVLELRRNPDYFVQGQPHADAYNRVIIADANTAQAAFRSGQGHTIPTNGQVTQLLKQSLPDLQVVDSKLWQAGSFISLIAMPAQGLNGDQRVRQAINRLIDREAIIRDVYFGSAWLNAGVYLPGVDWHLSDAELRNLLGRDVQQARQLLSAAGVDTASWKPVLDVGVAGTETRIAGELFVANLSEIGIQPTIRFLDKTEITERAYIRGESEIYLGSHRTSGGGTNGHLRLFFHSAGTDAAAFKQLGDKQLDDLIDRQSTILNNPEERKAILKEIQKRIIDDAAGMAAFTSNGEVAVSPKIGGYKQLPIESHRFAEAWVKV